MFVHFLAKKYLQMNHQKSKVFYLNPYLFAFFFGIIFLQNTKNAPAQIIPTPQKVVMMPDNFVFPKTLQVYFLNDAKNETLFSAQLLQKSIQNNFNIPVFLGGDALQSHIWIELIDSTQAKKLGFLEKNLQESYFFAIQKDKIWIKALHPKAVMYAVMSLKQIFKAISPLTHQGGTNTQNKKEESPKAKTISIPCQEVTDYPVLKMRGVSDDISRGQISNADNFKRIIENLALYKYNSYFLYIEDVLQLDNYSEIGKTRGALRKEEIKEIIDFAGKYYIDVYPIFETFGHQESILANPAFENMAEFAGAHSLCTSCPTTYQYLEKALKEVALLFTTPVIHIGGDESFDAGVHKSNKEAQRLGLAEIHRQHYEKVANICKKYNKNIWIYGDIILKYPQLLKQLPPNTTIMDWEYWPKSYYPSTATIKQSGVPYCVSPSVFNFKTVFPLHLYSFPNIQTYTQSGIRNDAQGMVVANWGDMGNEGFKELLYYGYAWAGQWAWKGKGDNTTFNNDFFAYFFGIKNELQTPTQNPNYASLVFQQISQPAQQVLWADFWRHPALEPRKPAPYQPNIDITARIFAWDSFLPNLFQNIENLKKSVTKNKENVEIIHLHAKLLALYSQKLKFYTNFKAFHQFPQKPYDMVIETEENIVSWKKMRFEYDNLWRKYYKEEGLLEIVKRFDHMILYFEEIKNHISSYQRTQNNNNTNDKLDKNQEKKYSFSPLSQASWIYVPLSKGGTQLCSEKALFRHEFNLENIPQNANLQLLADTYAELWVNGYEVGKVFVRNIFQLHLENEVVKWFDLKKYLQIGKNTIEIKAINYNRGLKNSGFLPNGEIEAGINCEISLEEAGEERKIYSNVSDWKGKIWYEVDKGLPFDKVIQKNYRSVLIAPNFSQNRKSWLEK